MQTIAIKQTDIDSREVDGNNHVAVPWEVLIMRGLADQGCRNVAGLRKYKLFLGENPRWRYYLEYHRHGTLDGLVHRYKEYNLNHPRNEYVFIPNPHPLTLNLLMEEEKAEIC